jgi:hypothetical protein
MSVAPKAGIVPDLVQSIREAGDLARSVDPNPAHVRNWPTCPKGHGMRYVGRQKKQRSRWDCPTCRTERRVAKVEAQEAPKPAQEIPRCGFCGSEQGDLTMTAHPWKAQAMFACASCAGAVGKVTG